MFDCAIIGPSFCIENSSRASDSDVAVESDFDLDNNFRVKPSLSFHGELKSDSVYLCRVHIETSRRISPELEKKKRKESCKDEFKFSANKAIARFEITFSG